MTTTTLQFGPVRVEDRNGDWRWQVRTTADGLYRVTVSTCLLGPREGPQAIRDVVYACVRDADGVGWSLIGRHRVIGAAVARCERHARMAGRAARRKEKEERRKERAEARKKKRSRMLRRGKRREKMTG